MENISGDVSELQQIEFSLLEKPTQLGRFLNFTDVPLQLIY